MYIGNKLGQMDGSTYASRNCVAAVTAALIDRVTVGGIRVTGAYIRKLTGDTSGGITEIQAMKAATQATGGQVMLEPRYGLSPDQVRDLAKSGRAFGILISCAVTRYTAFRTNYYTGLHELYVQRYDAGTDRYLIDDPGTTTAGFMWWPASLLHKAAAAGTGYHGLQVLVARDTEGVSRIAHLVPGTIRATPDVSAASKGSVQLGKAYNVLLTTNGGPWKREDGTTGDGWHKVRVGLTGSGYILGKRLR